MKMKEVYLNINCKVASFITVFLWASAFVLTKYVLKYTDVNTLAVIRYFIAGSILIFIVIKKKIFFPKILDLPFFFLAGFFGFSGYFILFNTAISLISPSTASIINTLSPAFTSIISYFLFKEKIKLIGWISLLISFLGILILTLWNGRLSINIGIIYMFVACLFISMYNVSQKWLSKKYNSFQVTTYSMIFGSLQLLIYSPNSLLNIVDFNLLIFLSILYMGLFPSVVAYIFWTRALEISKTTTEVTSFMFVTPVLATIMGIIILGDIPKISTFIGGGIVILGMILFNKTKNQN
nr:DMT family transporter [uncultured Fusobacterium sp.]